MSVLDEPLLTPAEVAAFFRVPKRTVARWASAGLLRAVPTPGGRLRRFRESEVAAFLASTSGHTAPETGAP